MTLDQLISEKWHWLSEADKCGFRIATYSGCATCGARFVDADDTIILEPESPGTYGKHQLYEVECRACLKARSDAYEKTPAGKAFRSEWDAMMAKMRSGEEPNG